VPVQSGSGVFSGSWLYVGLAVMWAVVLIPMWLRNHDQAQESRSADRFARAMSSLRRGRGETEASSREVLMPTRSRSSRATQVLVTGPRAERSPAAEAAARRRRALIGLLVVLTVTVVLVALGRLPLWTTAVPVLLVAGFLVVARRQVAQAAEMRRRRERRLALSEAARAAEAQHRTGRSDARRGGRVVDPAPVADPVRTVRREEHAATGTDAWSPVPTTLPTYVTAPRATKMPRVIDLTHPGAWTGAAMVEQARSSLEAQPVAEGEMRVETFQIAVPREEPAAYADRYVDDADTFEQLGGSEDLESLLEDPRSGRDLPEHLRRAANG
jgi:hypothetical protein